MPVDVSGGGPGLAAIAAAWLLSFLVHSTVLLGGAWLLTRRSGLAVSWSETLWKAATVGGILTATWQAVGIGVPSLGGTVILSALAGRPAPAGELASVLAGGSTLPAAHWWSGIDLPALLLGIWVLGAAAGLVRLVLARRRLARLLGPRREVREGATARMLDRLARDAGFRRRVRLTVSPVIGGPMALGGSEICIPERALVGLTPEQQESALAHELAHLARRDPGWNWAGAILGHVFFFQPLLRVARRRLRESAEYLSDDWAVRHTGRGIVLARCLVEVAGWRGARPAAAFGAAMAEHPSSLSRRIDRLIGGPRRGEPRRPLRLAGALALLFGVTALAPGVAPPPRSPFPEFDPTPWMVYSDACAVVEAPGAAIADPGVSQAPAPRVPLPSRSSPPPGEPEIWVVPSPPSVPDPPEARGDSGDAPALPSANARVRAPVVVVIVPRTARLASSPTPRVLRDEVMAPTAPVLPREVQILRSAADLQRLREEQLVVEREALLRGMDAERARMEDLRRALIEMERRGGVGEEEGLEMMLEAYRAQLRARLDALRAAAISDRI